MNAKVDHRPLLWLAGILAFFSLIWVALMAMGEQKAHNGPLWRQLHPVTARSAPLVVKTVAVVDDKRVHYVAVDSERGVFFLSGTGYVPADGQSMEVVSNERWDLFLCEPGDKYCVPIHSFCADTTFSKLKRDESGRIEGCYAPYLDTPRPPRAEDEQPPMEAAPGGMGKRKRAPPALGMSHPREWAQLMGLPVSR